ncbi:hypothetical protein ACTXPA_18455 [Glutamicibacter arilaitensis]|uniref:hypothetical protein n=1 Tax=Glutamicibacter arilaitensis TaxID=256701 RepID=UPI003FD3732D
MAVRRGSANRRSDCAFASTPYLASARTRDAGIPEVSTAPIPKALGWVPGK